MDTKDVTNLMTNLTSTMSGIQTLISTLIPAQPRAVIHSRLLGDVVAECLEAKARAGLRPRYLAQLRSSLGQFSAGVGQFVPFSTITPRQIEAWLHAKASWSNRTRLNYLVDVRTLFAFGQRQGYVRHNVAADVEKPVPEPEEPGILPLKEIWTVLMTAKELGLGPYVGVMLFAGVRPHEAQQIRAENFRGKSIIVYAGGAKTRKRRAIPILPALRAWLDYCGPCEWPPVNRHRKMQLLRKCIPAWPHDALRNCFISYALPIYGAVKVSTWAGNTEGVMFSSYVEIVTEEDAQALWGMFCELAPPKMAMTAAA